MTSAEIAAAIQDGLLADFEGLDLSDVRSDADGRLFVNGYTALSVGTISSALSQAGDLEIKDAAGDGLGTLCFCQQLGTVNQGALTKYQFVAFLTEAAPEDLADGTFRFQNDYVVSDPGRFTDYHEKYAYSSAIWGRFSHSLVSTLETPNAPAFIIAVADLAMPTPHHLEAFGRYLRANNPLERFLRLYQTVELLFDYIVFKKVQALGNNLDGFGKLINDHGRTEIDRLKSIVREYCQNPLSIANALMASSAYPDEREQIFHAYTKQGDPAADNVRWERLVEILDDGAYSEVTARQKGFVSQTITFQQFTADVAAYWIYRVRSSIAHNRVSEFVLEDRHAEFITNFAEPLMVEVVKQIFANPEFSALTN